MSEGLSPFNGLLPHHRVKVLSGNSSGRCGTVNTIQVYEHGGVDVWVRLDKSKQRGESIVLAFSPGQLEKL